MDHENGKLSEGLQSPVGDDFHSPRGPVSSTTVRRVSAASEIQSHIEHLLETVSNVSLRRWVRPYLPISGDESEYRYAKVNLGKKDNPDNGKLPSR